MKQHFYYVSLLLDPDSPRVLLSHPLIYNNKYWNIDLFREFVTEMLEKAEEGSFFVRDSQSRPGCYALTMRVPQETSPSGFGNFLIVKVKDGVMIQVSTNQVSYTLLLSREALPLLKLCKLRISLWGSPGHSLFVCLCLFFVRLRFFFTAAWLAQLVEHLTAEREVAGSIPRAGSIFRILK